MKTLCIQTAAVHGVAPRKGATAVDSHVERLFSWRSRFTGVGVRVPFPSHMARSAVLCGRRRVPPVCGGATAAAARRQPTGRARADGERRRHLVCPSASYAVARARFKESLELVSTAHDRATRVLSAASRRRRDERPPGRRFSVTVVCHSYWYVSECDVGPRVR